MSPASYAVLKNLNEPFYFFLQVKIDKPSPTLLLSLLVCLIKSGVRAGCFFVVLFFQGSWLMENFMLFLTLFVAPPTRPHAPKD